MERKRTIKRNNGPRKTQTIRQTARDLGWSYAAVKEKVESGELPAIAVGNRFYIPLQALDEYLRTAGKR
jgi:excisionase family DNA binding protein